MENDLAVFHAPQGQLAYHEWVRQHLACMQQNNQARITLP
jgi:hypothetical protein